MINDGVFETLVDELRRLSGNHIGSSLEVWQQREKFIRILVGEVSRKWYLRMSRLNWSRRRTAILLTVSLRSLWTSGTTSIEGNAPSSIGCFVLRIEGRLR